MPEQERSVGAADPPVCHLLEVATGEEHDCDGGECVYWRVLEHIGEDAGSRAGCAIGHFELLADRNPEVAAWLLSVKRRMDALESACV
jgi:hypothetical protein